MHTLEALRRIRDLKRTIIPDNLFGEHCKSPTENVGCLSTEDRKKLAQALRNKKHMYQPPQTKKPVREEAEK